MIGNVLTQPLVDEWKCFIFGPGPYVIPEILGVSSIMIITMCASLCKK